MNDQTGTPSALMTESVRAAATVEISDPATNMVPSPQPTSTTLSQVLLHELPDFKMYRELAVVEL